MSTDMHGTGGAYDREGGTQYRVALSPWIDRFTQSTSKISSQKQER